MPLPPWGPPAPGIPAPRPPLWGAICALFRQRVVTLLSSTVTVVSAHLRAGCGIVSQMNDPECALQP